MSIIKPLLLLLLLLLLIYGIILGLRWGYRDHFKILEESPAKISRNIFLEAGEMSTTWQLIKVVKSILHKISNYPRPS